MPNLADHTSVLTPATAKTAPKTVEWSGEMEEAFQTIIVSICNHVVLTIPSLSDTYAIRTDASGRGLGSVLLVERDGEYLPVAFRSRQLTQAERNYAATELERRGRFSGAGPDGRFAARIR